MTKKKLIKSLKLDGLTSLELNVAEWVNCCAVDYPTSGVHGVLEDLSHGCSSGIVSHLIYTRDCVAFYQKHQQEIDALLYQALRDCDLSPSQLFERSNWDDHDPMAREDNNQNILAWFGFETTASALADRAGIEL